MKRIIKTIILITIVIIPNVKAITSDEVIYQDDTVTKALDELNICAISGDATSEEILSGKSAYVQGKLVVGTIPSKGETTYIPTTTRQIINSGQYLSGDQIIEGDENLLPENIKSGTSIFGIEGTYGGTDTSDADAEAEHILKDKTAYVKGELVTGTIPSKGASTYTPSTSNQTISAGQYLSGAQTIKGDVALNAANIRCGVTIFGVTGTDGCGTYKFNAKVGDYVKMTPTKTSYSIATSLTGYKSAQTINPSELNLWRIIKLNSDGTIEMVSENVSSVKVYFSGQTGYKKLVGSLNTIASQYANTTYTSKYRHMGYSNQTANLNVTLSQPACGTSSTKDNSKETSGCGDIGYETDVNLVKSAIGFLGAYPANGYYTTDYWLGSRDYTYYSNTHFSFLGNLVNTSGSFSFAALYVFNGGSVENSQYSAIRPIVTLKSGATPSSGKGKASSPWVFA